jgi:tRNA G26 N,N-dimethylase Trm1
MAKTKKQWTDEELEEALRLSLMAEHPELFDVELSPAVRVACLSEKHQAQVIEQLRELGFECAEQWD